MSTVAKRKQVAEDTLARAASIVDSTPGASSEGIFIDSQLPELNQALNPAYGETDVLIVNSDSYTAARKIARSVGEDARGKIAVLNLASDALPGGGWKVSLSRTQEEALCYSSTLYPTLNESWYPWPNTGPGSIAGVYSPGVVVFKDDLDHECANLRETDRLVVGVLTVAAPRGPRLSADGEMFADANILEDMRGKIRLVYRMAAHNGHPYLVLAAMGCGAYLCPPKQVAEEMKNILLEPEFHGWFQSVVFAIYSTPHNGGRNFAIFEETFKGTKLNVGNAGTQPDIDLDTELQSSRCLIC